MWGIRGGPLSEAGAIGPSGLSVGWKLPQFHAVSNLIKSKEYVPAEKTGLLVWPCREGCIVLFGPVSPTICQHSCLVTCSLLFLLFTQDECDTGGFLQSRRWLECLWPLPCFLEALVRCWMQPEAALFLSLFPVYPFSWRSLFSLGEREEGGSVSTTLHRGIWCEPGGFTILKAVWHRASVLVAACLIPWVS